VIVGGDLVQAGTMLVAAGAPTTTLLVDGVNHPRVLGVTRPVVRGVRLGGVILPLDQRNLLEEDGVRLAGVMLPLDQKSLLEEDGELHVK